MPAVRIVEPDSLLSLDQVKTALRIDHDDENEYLADVVIPAAVDEVERYVARALLPQRWRLKLDRSPGRVILFPRPPLKAIVSISYRRTDGTLGEIDPASCQIDVDSQPGRLAPVPGTIWPAIGAFASLAPITIVFEAGYEPARVPPVYTAAALATADHLYQRGPAAGLPDAVARTLAGKRVRWFGESP